jgi:nucleoside-diphosphate-sugar epimerase
MWRGTVATIWRNVIPTFVWKSLHGEELPLDKGGVATRDFVYVDDIVEGLMLCAINGQSGEVYNLATAVETSIIDLAATVNRLTGNKAGVAINGARDWDRSGKRYGQTTKSERELGFRPKVSLDDGLSRTIQWTKDNIEIVRRCMSQHEYFQRVQDRTQA